MDIISYGSTSKASKEVRYTRNDVLGENIRKGFSTMKERIDRIDDSIKGVTKQADKLIVQNAVNIMKANAKLNAIAKSKKYNMHQMIFDDLLDLSGIDISKSKNYEHDQVSGIITALNSCIIETNVEESDAMPKEAIFSIDADGEENKYEISRDGGESWSKIDPETLFHFKDGDQDLVNRIKLRFFLSEKSGLSHYALTWSS